MFFETSRVQLLPSTLLLRLECHCAVTELYLISEDIWALPWNSIFSRKTPNFRNTYCNTFEYVTCTCTRRCLWIQLYREFPSTRQMIHSHAFVECGTNWFLYQESVKVMSLKLECLRRSWNQTPWKDGLWLNLTLNLSHCPDQEHIDSCSPSLARTNSYLTLQRWLIWGSCQHNVELHYVTMMSTWWSHEVDKACGETSLKASKPHSGLKLSPIFLIQLCPSSTSPLCILTCGNNLELAY